MNAGEREAAKEAGEAASGCWRVFHLSEGASHKFWSIQVAGSVQSVRFGRIGAAGQSCTKAFPSAADAAKETQRLILSKQKKGYREVSAEEAASVPPRPRTPRRAWRQLELPF